MIVCVTGHRPQKLPKDVEGEMALQDFVRRGVRWFCNETKAQWMLSGMAPGVDLWATEEMLTGVPQIQVCAALPCLEQDKYWGTETKAKYHSLLARVHRQHLVTAEPYQKHVMQRRNQWMVDNSQAVFAVYDGTPGGTANAVKYAIETKRTIFVVDPRTREAKWLT